MSVQGTGVPYWRLSAFYFFYFAFLGAWAPYWNLYLESLAYDASSIGILSAIVLGTKIIAPSLWGWLADKTQRRLSVIRLGSFLAFLMFLAMFIDQQYRWLIAVVTLYSFFWNAVLSQFEVVTLSHLQGHFERYSQIRLWGSIGFILAVAGLGYAFDVFSISYLPWFLSALLLGIWLSSLVVFENSESARVEDNERTTGLLEIVKQPSVLAFFVSCFLLQVAHGPYYTFYSIYLEGFGYSRSAIGLLWALGVLAEVVLFIFIHHLLVRFSLRSILLFTLTVAVLRWLLIAYFAESLTMLILAQIAHAATFGSYHAVAIELVRRHFSSGHQGQGQAIYSGISFGAGGALGALLSGLLWEKGAQETFLLASVASLLAWLMCFIWVKGPELERHGT
jgi:PPP family 3-phenylpropionic acid transporter